MRDLTKQIFIELLRSYHDGIGVTHSAHPQVEVAGRLAREARVMAAEFDEAVKFDAESNVYSKPFDITKYKFSEEDVECELAAGNNLLLINNTGYNCIPFSKSDAIAIAKALGVTGEDLK